MMRSPTRFSTHLRDILALGLPLIGGHLAQLAIGIADTMMMGWYGVHELAAIVLGSSFYHVLFLFGTGFGFAIMPLISVAMNNGHDRDVRRVTRMALWLSIVFSLLSYPVFFFSQEILRGLGQEARLSEDAAGYLQIMGLGLLPALLVMTMRTYFAALGQVRIMFAVVLVTLLFNVLGNYMLIYGKLGAPELGLVGAAWASLGAQVFGFVLIVLIARMRFPEHQLLVRFWRADWEKLARVFQLGLPIGLTTLAEVMLFSATAVFMGWIGSVPLAAHGIALQITAATFMIHVGLSNVATIRVGNAFGRGDYAQLRQGVWALLLVALIVVALTIAAFFIIPAEMTSWFLDTEDPQFDEIVTISVTLLAVAAFFQVADAGQVLGVALLRGLQDTNVPFGIAFLGYWALGAPAAYLLAFPLGFGPVGLWYGLLIGLSVAAIFLWWRFYLLSRDRRLQRLAKVVGAQDADSEGELQLS